MQQVLQELVRRLGTQVTTLLGKLSPQDPHTMTFQWSYAMLRQDYGEAKRLVAAMEKTDMNRLEFH